MYPDDFYHPSNGNDVDNYALNQIKGSTGQFHRVKKRVAVKNALGETDHYTTKKIEYYSTNVTAIGQRIRNALTGQKYADYFIGSRDEDYFFKVRIVNGETPEGVTLFYETPEEFESHQKVKVDENVKTAWAEKRLLSVRKTKKN
jgi:hypothetical protein